MCTTNTYDALFKLCEANEISSKSADLENRTNKDEAAKTPDSTAPSVLEPEKADSGFFATLMRWLYA